MVTVGDVGGERGWGVWGGGGGKILKELPFFFESIIQIFFRCYASV